MPAALLLIFLLPAAADWLAVWKGWQRVNFFTKPLAMIALIIGFGLRGHFKGSLLWFGIGFCFSLLGDVFLLLSHGYFLYGLSAFLGSTARCLRSGCLSIYWVSSYCLPGGCCAGVWIWLCAPPRGSPKCE